MKRAETIQEYHDQAKTCLHCIEQFWARCVAGEAGAKSIGLTLQALIETLETEPDQDSEARSIMIDVARGSGTSPHRLGGQVGYCVHDAVFRFGLAVVRAVECGMNEIEDPPGDPLSWSGGNVEEMRSFIQQVMADSIRIDVEEIAETKIMLENEYAAAKGAESEGDEPPANVAHSEDYRSLKWYGTEYSFTARQAPAVKILYENWEKGGPDVGGDYIAENAECGRISDLFKGHPAWNSVIVSKTKGSYRLQEPEK